MAKGKGKSGQAGAKKTEKLLPVTVLSGFLGAGKTTLLNHLLNNVQGYRIAIIVNDMAEVNVDAQLVKKHGGELSKVKESMVELQNGCICCTLREDLLIEVKRLAQTGKFDYLLIESSGISEPLQVAETFTFDDESGEYLKTFARLDTMVTVVDAFNLWKDYQSSDLLLDRSWEATEEDQRTIAQLLTEQIEFADIVLVNKCDLVKEDQLQKMLALVKKLNPRARVIRTTKSVIDPSEVLDTGMFDFEKASENPLWLAEPRGSHVPETVEYGISSFIYRARRPFHNERLSELLEQGPRESFKGIHRVKGSAWLSSSMSLQCNWNQAGTQLQLDPGNPWVAAVPEEERPEMPPGMWQEPYGDRRQELVIIGEDLLEGSKRRAQLEAKFNAALLTDAEFKKGPDFWLTLPDPIGMVDEESEDDEDDDDDEDEDDDRDEEDDEVVTLTADNFDSTLKDQSVLVDVFAPWCKPCKKLEPAYREAAAKLKEAGSLSCLAVLDGDDPNNSKIVDRLGVKTFPTLKWFENGTEKETYSGAHTAAALVKFVKSKEGAAASQKTSPRGKRSQAEPKTNRSTRSASSAPASSPKKRARR